MKLLWLCLSLLFLTPSIGCSYKDEKPTTLRDAFKDHFYVGATVDKNMFLSANDASLSLAKQQFATLTTGNAFKWAVINPKPGEYNFEVPDKFVELGQTNQLRLVGHVLFWHSQTPDWVFADENGAPLKREALLNRMRARAKTLADRYGSTIKTWDVVNEAYNDDGSLRNSKFHQIIGDDFIEQAFRIAAEAFPGDCDLLYNDYGMTKVGRKNAVIAMIEDLKTKGVKIDGIGVQGHWSMDTPTISEIDQTITELAETQLPIHITELDIDYLGRDQYYGANVDIKKLPANAENNPYAKGNFPSTADKQLTKRYSEVFSVLLKHSANIERVTFWGVTDADSWLNDWPIKGRTNYPLLFKRDVTPKPAFYELLKQGYLAQKTTLKSAFERKFLMGAALTDEMLADPQHPSFQIVKTHFNSITPANALKWAIINPLPNVYTPELADALVEYGVAHNLDIVGHTLFWHEQTPDWVFEDGMGNPASRELLLQRMRERVRYLAQRYGEKIKTWDVVNEAIEDDGSIRKSKFSEIIGDDFMEQAFKIAAEELPSSAKLIYNDYNFALQKRLFKVLQKTLTMRAKGIRVDGVGIQGHWELKGPNLRDIRLALALFALTNTPVYITELDVDYLSHAWFFKLTKEEIEKELEKPELNPFADGQLPNDEQQKFTERYEAIFQLFLDYPDTIERVTFWGVTDSDSWLNDWPVKGRTNFGLLFDRDYKPKPAVNGILRVGNAEAAINSEQ